MGDGLGQSELAADQSGAAARVGDEARLHGADAAGALDVDDVVLRPALVQSDAPDLAAVQHLDAGGDEIVEQRVLEPPAIELERRHDRELRRAELDPPGDVAIAGVREEVAQPELLELPGAQVRLEAEDRLEVVGANLDARLADLVCRLPDRVRRLLGDQHAEMRRLEMKLPCERETGQASA